jgi:hypothetical protein
MGDIRDKPKLVHGVILPSSTTPRTSLARRHPPPRSSDARRGHAVGAALGPQTPAGRSAPSGLRREPSLRPVFSAGLPVDKRHRSCVRALTSNSPIS